MGGEIQPLMFTVLVLFVHFRAFSFVTRKLLSLNIRGFGVGVDSKIGWFKSLCRVEKPNIVLLQETKLHSVDLNWVRGACGFSNCNFIQKAMVGKSRGQLVVWDVDYFDVTDSFVSDFCIGVRGKWKNSGMESNIINVYGPHDDNNKQRLWDFLLNLILKKNDQPWVVCGDFNEVRNASERFNCNYIDSRAKKFNEFIDMSKLIDIAMGGRTFTRVSDDGLKFSKLDRFLINDSFHNMWSCVSVVALDRGKSDHCPIVLKDDERNFGPKPIKVFDEWLDLDNAESCIKEVWSDPGGGGARLDSRLRNKLKKVKFALKAASSQKFGNLDEEIEMFKSLANALELRTELGQISDMERE
ncbi:uncharacterized protein [Rutidosis leptorrhynchoides]|uniref:uncharacterized protein n=1 Tax=Rutidosis leptorrhynchoides TaxID=125765 RepID=UPI003A99ABED